MNSVLGLLVISIVFGHCVALECYSCRGESDCGEPFNSTSTETVTCSDNSVCSVWLNFETDQYTRSCVDQTNFFCEHEGCSRRGGADGGYCSYCCEDDLCNGRSIADGVADILHCYWCYSDTPDAACANDVRIDNVHSSPCDDGVCMVRVSTFNNSTTFRTCRSSEDGACVPGCDGFGRCTACCTENLCNNGSVESTNNGGNIKNRTCYSCAGGTGCGEPFTLTSTETCTSNNSVCNVLLNLETDQYTRRCVEQYACVYEGCTRGGGAAGFCTYCCDDDLCNGRSIADGVADILHCYMCSSDKDAACANDVRNASVPSLQCKGVCMVQEVSTSDTDLTRRTCLPSDDGACVPGCDGSGTCTACCTENLCNHGSVESINNGGNMKTMPSSVILTLLIAFYTAVHLG